ncbi:MAG: hypothetical protein R3313_02895 [Candidatus Saccharimonadales bacterium]|nr:hypothetical protein [Candidatus Saccharimonadales bacterium]
MLKLDQRGATTPMAIPMIILSVLVVIMTVVAIWSYMQYTNQKNNVDSLIEDAIVEAQDDLRADIQADFDQQEKSPLKTYVGSESLGKVTIKYPKTWSAYILESETGKTPIDGYFHPDYVPSVKSDTAFALRLKLLNNTFQDVADDYDRSIKNGAIKSKPIKISGEDGLRLEGEISRNRQGVLVILPLRDKTISLSTQSNDYIDDFNNIILENLTFIP